MQSDNNPDYELNETSGQASEHNAAEKRANRFCIISLICELLPILISGVVISTIQILSGTEPSSSPEIIISILSTLNLLLIIIGLILMIYVRVKYPKNIWGKVLMWLYIIFAIIALIFFTLYLMFAVATMISCFDCLTNM